MLIHIVPADGPVEKFQRAQEGFSDNPVVGEDLMNFCLGEPNTE